MSFPSAHNRILTQDIRRHKRNQTQGTFSIRLVQKAVLVGFSQRACSKGDRQVQVQWRGPRKPGGFNLSGRR